MPLDRLRESVERWLEGEREEDGNGEDIIECRCQARVFESEVSLQREIGSAKAEPNNPAPTKLR